MPPRELIDAIDAAIQGGVNMVQLRDRAIDRARARTDLAVAVRDVTNGSRGVCGKRRPRIGGACRARTACTCRNRLCLLSNARQIVGPGALVGRSVHSTAAAASAAGQGADYLIAGTVYPSPTHPGGTASGTAIIRSIVGVVDLPVMGIGGIDASNAARVMGAGARGVACISAILAAKDPRLAAAAIAEQIDQRGPDDDTQ